MSEFIFRLIVLAIGLGVAFFLSWASSISIYQISALLSLVIVLNEVASRYLDNAVMNYNFAIIKKLLDITEENDDRKDQ